MGMVEFICLMACFMALTAMSIDIMLPALPLIRDAYGLTDGNQQQLVVIIFLVGFGFGQLFYGPLSDRLGRKPVIMLGVGIYAAATIMCLMASSFEMLIAMRFMQGIGAAAPRVVSVAVIRDLYHGRRMAEVMSFVMTVFIMVPAIAPAMGSGILLLGDWHEIFMVLAAFSLLVMGWTAWRLAETRPPEARTPLSAAWLAQAFRETVTNRQTLGYTIAISACFGGMISYISSAQQIFADVYGMGQWFPLLFGLVAVALSIAAIINGRLVNRLGMRRLGHLAMTGFFTIALLHLCLDLLFHVPLVLFVSLMSAQLFCFGFIMPNYNALAMEPMGRIAGTASSFIGAVTTALAAFLGWMVGQAYDGSTLPISIGFACFGAAALAVTFITEGGRLFNSETGNIR